MELYVHLPAKLHSSIPVARLVGEIKSSSSYFANHRLGLKGSFEWQSGFGAFTIATDDVPALSSYVNAQEEHHAIRALEPTLELAEDV